MSDYTSLEDERFFGAFGRLTISWAHLEFGLDCMVDLMYRGADGKSIEAEIPRALKRKIAFLRASFRRLPIEEAAIAGYMGLFDRIQEASVTRHDIIHGVITDHVERSGEATMVRILRDKEGFVKKPFNVTTTSVLEAAGEAQRLGTQVLSWVGKTTDLIHELSQQDGERKPS